MQRRSLLFSTSATLLLGAALLVGCAGPRGMGGPGHHGMMKRPGYGMAPAAAASAPTGAPMVANGLLTGPNGMTLYTFDNDAANSGKSVCNGPCATNWPPLMAGNAAPGGDYSVVTRDDGGKQLAYKGKPLYYWIKDTKPGDKTGDGVNGVWHVVKP
jgi:predicted lipoprotein with Yx(FWY)xxD motif